MTGPNGIEKAGPSTPPSTPPLTPSPTPEEEREPRLTSVGRDWRDSQSPSVGVPSLSPPFPTSPPLLSPLPGTPTESSPPLIFLDGPIETFASLRVKDRLLAAARPANVSSLEEVERICEESAGVSLFLDHKGEVKLELGSRFPAYPEFEVGELLRYPCCANTGRRVAIGRLVFGPDDYGMLIVVYTVGDRCYVLSQFTGTLYIVSDRGLEELLLGHGYRHVYEVFDDPVVADERFDGDVSVSLLSFASCRDLGQVREYVRRWPRLTTVGFDGAVRPVLGDHLRGDFMVGDESALGLSDLFPDLVFSYLADAGYRVIGRGEFGLVVLCNEILEVFVLMDEGRVLKVANTLPGFLRDRLRFNLRPFRRAFRPTGDDLTLGCVGQLRPFRCEVDYVLPGLRELRRWLAEVDAATFVGLELRVPTL